MGIHQPRTGIEPAGGSRQFPRARRDRRGTHNARFHRNRVFTLTALADLKAQLNITDDADDALLERKIAAAEAAVTGDIGADDPVTYDAAPADLREAVLMLAAHLYENREAVLVGVGAEALPLGYDHLVQSHRKWVF